ncbi:hypothetical protein HG536_0C04800 [Torulaspora globosa]|uniref:CBM21 domain-containing protein n=1 Tax=Torulaspora globosa TaxID=48254 RepID=A0A7G3ZFM5_9SACH|nr:uncharacterized protein HG536_0C04800 [Torulaspora globosa]QLL32311.1 hypothetical protein HG536_0C04800 [Torulaspora globosa]
MYIKAEKVTNDHQTRHDKLRPTLNLMARRAQTNNLSSINSLNFLHKPQRVSHLKTNLFPEEEIVKNTNLNKRLDSSPSSPTGTRDDAGAYDEQLAFAPVYKKSGELVKSSLKRRSKSLPTSPYVGSENRSLAAAARPPGLQRSKSVHFDHKTPVKYFCEDESPIDVSSHSEKTEDISYQHKPVKSIYDSGLDDAEDEFLSMGIDRLRLQPPAAGDGPAARAPSSLRKSKRFSQLLKTSSAAAAPAQAPAPSPDNRIVGLYSRNFPILSNKNPKALKLNIFINLSRDKKCFLQDLTLCARKGSTADRVIAGRILVKNIFYDKRVVVRYTWDQWRTAHDVESVYVSDGDAILPGTNMDLFHFRIDDLPHEHPHAHLEFCIHYVVRNDRVRQEYWDNNDAQNYKVDCVFEGFHNPFT